MNARTAVRILIILLTLPLLAGCMPGLNSQPLEPTLQRRFTSDPQQRVVSYIVNKDAESTIDSDDADTETETPDPIRVIYIHGTPGSGSILRNYIIDPVPGTESIAVDRLGFGESEPVPVVSYHEQAQAIAALIDPDDPRGVILVGHSLGGPIAARLAADHPDRVAGLVILAGALDPELEKPRWFNRVGGLPIVCWLIGQPLRHSNCELLAAPGQARQLDHDISNIRAHTVVIHGRNDSLVPVENVAYMRRAMTGVASFEAQIIEDEGHFIPWTHEQQIRDTVAGLVERINAEQSVGISP